MGKGNEKLIDPNLVGSLLYDDDNYIVEFAEASVDSFSTFKSQFADSLLQRDMINLRKAGHKIKPVAQILQVDVIIEKYEQSKQLLEENTPSGELEELAEEVSTLCNRIIDEFESMIRHHKIQNGE